jgi:hypothetical protein
MHLETGQSKIIKENMAANAYMVWGGPEEKPSQRRFPMASPEPHSLIPPNISFFFIIYSLIFHVRVILRSSESASVGLLYNGGQKYS